MRAVVQGLSYHLSVINKIQSVLQRPDISINHKKSSSSSPIAIALLKRREWDVLAREYSGGWWPEEKNSTNTNGIRNHHCCHNCCYRHGMLKLQDVLDIQEVAGLNFRRKKVPQVLDLVTAGLQAKS